MGAATTRLSLSLRRIGPSDSRDLHRGGCRLRNGHPKLGFEFELNCGRRKAQRLQFEICCKAEDTRPFVGYTKALSSARFELAGSCAGLSANYEFQFAF